MSVKSYIFTILVFAGIFNIYKLFQFAVVSNYDPTTDFPREIYNEIYCETKKNFYCDFFRIMKLSTIFINDILIYLINFIIDLVLIKSFRSYLAQKQKILNNNEDSSKKTNKITKMVIISNILHLVSYFPEFIASIFIITYSHNIAKFFDYNFTSNLVNEEFEFFGLISISMNFFILCNFNRNFYDGFQLIKYNIFKNL